MPPPIAIRRLTTIAEMRQVEAAEREIWGMPPAETVPTHLLLTAAQNGGLILGALAGEMLVGLLFGFIGQDDAGRFKHCSHIMGVRDGYRRRGIAQALKWAQREAVLAQGLDLVTWTYDPLEAPNARLNLHLLGTLCNTLHPNHYGEMDDALNAGLPSDRFEVTWWLGSERVRRRAAGDLPVSVARPPLANPPQPGRWHRPAPWTFPAGDQTAVAIPTDFQALRRADPPLALAWRLHTREIFAALFAAGFIAHDFVVGPEPGQGHYLMRRGEGGGGGDW